MKSLLQRTTPPKFALIVLLAALTALAILHNTWAEKGQNLLPRMYQLGKGQNLMPKTCQWTPIKSQAEVYPGSEWLETQWADEPGVISLKYAEDNAHQIFAGKSILVIGGSTSRSFSGDFLQMLLPPEERLKVSHSWIMTGASEYVTTELMPRTSKGQWDFSKQCNQTLIKPLMAAGWSFTHIVGPYSGCLDCTIAYNNIDWFAELHGGATRSSKGITYEYSWKPELFTETSDPPAFHHRYCPPNNRYDVVYIGRGLHDAAFKENLDMDTVDEKLQRLGKLLSCFPPQTLIVIRTPYDTAVNHEISKVKNITSKMVQLTNEGIFGRNRTVLINGHLLTSSEGHPTTIDGHHYGSSVARSVVRLIASATFEFSKQYGWGRMKSDASKLSSKWQGCGLTMI